MIVFDLKCAGGHVFEAWFASSAAWDEQRERRQVVCPICNIADVEKAIMAPNVAAKGNARAAPTPDAVKTAMKQLATAQAEALKTSRWVGKDFAKEARAIHGGDRPQESIHGQATLADAKALIADGVAVAPLPFPVAPPKSLN